MVEKNQLFQRTFGNIFCIISTVVSNASEEAWNIFYAKNFLGGLDLLRGSSQVEVRKGTGANCKDL